MTRDVRHTLLLLLGGVLLRVAADDTALRYVRPGHRWLLVAAGAVTVLLALAGLATDLRRRAARDPQLDPHDPHGHGHGRAPWLLLLPVLVLGLMPPPALGADAVGRDATAPVRGADLYPPLPAGPVDLPLGEVVDRAVWDEAHSVAGRDVVVTGFLARRHGEPVLARMRITCCAADARASALRLRGPVAPGGPDRGAPEPDGPERWLRVRGRVVPGTGTPADRYLPDLVVTAVEPVAAPADPYEY